MSEQSVETTQPPTRPPTPAAAAWAGGCGRTASAFALWVLRRQLRAVRSWVRRVGGDHAPEVEAVHQLRVATRRARAALQLFGSWLPARHGRWLERRLKDLRRAAGKIRDLDVLGQRLAVARQDEDDRRSARGWTALERLLAARRRRAARPLRRAGARWARREDRRRFRALLTGVRWRGSGPEPTVAQAARAALASRVDKLRAAARRLREIDDLHRLRIRAKQLRYTLELLAPVLDEAVVAQRAFAAMQRDLGAVHDHAVALETFTRWRRKPKFAAARRVLEARIAAERGRLDAATERFRRRWKGAKRRALAESLAGLAGGSEVRGPTDSGVPGAQDRDTAE
ncbi:MAG: CHAD domain-containing protein [Planctomycetes bacterium]|nr:CHAD domain-containing protein [Planctomycetota bacterium]